MIVSSDLKLSQGVFFFFFSFAVTRSQWYTEARFRKICHVKVKLPLMCVYFCIFSVLIVSNLLDVIAKWWDQMEQSTMEVDVSHITEDCIVNGTHSWKPHSNCRQTWHWSIDSFGRFSNWKKTNMSKDYGFKLIDGVFSSRNESLTSLPCLTALQMK